MRYNAYWHCKSNTTNSLPLSIIRPEASCLRHPKFLWLKYKSQLILWYMWLRNNFQEKCSVRQTRATNGGSKWKFLVFRFRRKKIWMEMGNVVVIHPLASWRKMEFSGKMEGSWRRGWLTNDRMLKGLNGQIILVSKFWSNFFGIHLG